MKEPVWLEKTEVLLIHGRLLALNGGGTGLREVHLLDFALAKPKQLYHYGKNLGIVEMAAAYIIGIVKNQPFMDGNKRVGFVLGVMFLELNGYQFMASEEDAAAVIIALAAGKLDEAGVTGFLRDNSSKV